MHQDCHFDDAGARLIFVLDEATELLGPYLLVVPEILFYNSEIYHVLDNAVKKTERSDGAFCTGDRPSCSQAQDLEAKTLGLFRSGDRLWLDLWD